MRWKILLLFALLSAAVVVVVSSDGDDVTEDVEQVDTYDEIHVKEGVVDQYDTVETEDESNTDPSEAPVIINDEQINEDSVDVDVEPIAKVSQKGKYQSYDDYSFLNSVLDQTDSNYGWNGE